jgi:hypothetical protein
MRTAIQSHVVQLRNRLFSQLPLPMQIWVRQQADQTARSRRFGVWEQMRLSEVIQQKFLRSSPAGVTDIASVRSIVEFLVLTDAITGFEEKLQTVGEDAQLANVDLQNMLQQQQQTLQLLSNISKAQHDTALSVIRKIGG